MKRRITTREQLVAWLDESGWFEESMITRLDPVPDEGPCPREAVLVLELQVGGSLRAGEPRVMRTFSIEFEGLRTWSLEDWPGFERGTYLHDAVDVPETEAPLALRLEVPGLLTAEFEALRVDQAEDRTERVPPWASTWELFATVSGASLPAPADWLLLFRQVGCDCAWRFHQGTPRPPECVSLETGGWSLQLVDRVAATRDGLTFQTAKPTEGGFRLSIAVSDDEGARLWKALGQTMASFPRVEIACGNVTFTGTEWRRYLETGEFPEGAR